MNTLIVLMNIKNQLKIWKRKIPSINWKPNVLVMKKQNEQKKLLFISMLKMEKN